MAKGGKGGSGNQKGVEKIIKSHGGEKVKGRDKTFDMTKAVKKEGENKKK